jgi:hypothetical protein
MTLDELIERIRQVAGANVESPLLNTTMLIEIVLPRVMQKVAADAVRDDNQLNALRADHTLSIVSGVVSCPATIKEEYAESIVFLSAPATSYKTDAFDFSNGSSLFDAFRVDSGNIHFRQAGLSAGIFTGTKTINAITLPALPTLSTDTVNLKDNLLQEVIAVTASLIKGEIPLAAFGLENISTSPPARS